jgi:hypothetical protein
MPKAVAVGHGDRDLGRAGFVGQRDPAGDAGAAAVDGGDHGDLAAAVDGHQPPQHRLGQPRHGLQEAAAPGLVRQPGEEPGDQLPLVEAQRPQVHGGGVAGGGQLPGGVGRVDPGSRTHQQVGVAST